MLPGATTTREPIKRDFYDMDSLLAELAVPKEQIQRNTPPQPGGGSAEPGQPAPRMYIDGPEGEPIETEKLAPEVAAMSGKMIANTIDLALGTGLSLYAKNTTPEKYQATPPQKECLQDAWTAVAAKYNYKVEDSPWFNALIQTGAVYIPHVMEAKTDRRIAILEEKQREDQAAREALEKRVEQIEQKNANPAA